MDEEVARTTIFLSKEFSMQAASVMIVEDNCIVAQDLAELIEGFGFEVCAVCHSPEQAMRSASQCTPDVILMDIELDGALSGIDLAERMKEQTAASLLFLSGHTEHEVLMRAGKSHADGYILKPYDPRQLAISLHMALTQRSRKLQELAASPEKLIPNAATEQVQLGRDIARECGIIGSSAAMRDLLEATALVAPTDVGVLITGENGTGKELVAEALHKASLRSTRPFIGINCSAIPSTLLESALFGHARGAFTGAHRDQEGFLERAEGGTLFLDEIGDVSPEIQVKLLRLLQSRIYHRVGETEIRQANVRIIAATNRDLQELVASGRIREDFFYRINVFPIAVPPLREREDDIVEIAEHFRGSFNRVFNKNIRGFSDDAIAALRKFGWPGNVRQLENAIKRAFVVAPGPDIELHHLPPELATGQSRQVTDRLVFASTAHVLESERDRILAALARTGGHKGKAAALLGYSRITLWKKLTKLGMASASSSEPGLAEDSSEIEPQPLSKRDLFERNMP
jgi:DNA-binding NtrC family response regulator